MDKLKDKIEKYINKTGVIKTPAYFIKDLFNSIIEFIDKKLNKEEFNYHNEFKMFEFGYSKFIFAGRSYQIFNTFLDITNVESMYIEGIGLVKPAHYYPYFFKNVFIKFKDNIIPERAFFRNNNFIDFKLNDNIDSIERESFRFTNWKGYTNPKNINVRKVDDESFNKCNFGNKVRDIGRTYLYGYNDILKLPKGLNTVDTHALQFNYSLYDITFPLNVKKIDFTEDHPQNDTDIFNLTFTGFVKTLNISTLLGIKEIKFYSKYSPTEIVLPKNINNAKLFIPEQSINYDVTLWENAGFDIEYFKHRCIGDAGVYIIDTDGFLYNEDEYNKEIDVLGIYCSDGNHYFIINIYDIGEHACVFPSSYTGIKTFTLEEALSDFNGFKNTNYYYNYSKDYALNQDKGIGAFNVIQYHEFEIGNKSYIGSGGEWLLVLNNLNEINNLLNCVGGKLLDINEVYTCSVAPFYIRNGQITEQMSQTNNTAKVRPFMQFDYPELEEETN